MSRLGCVGYALYVMALTLGAATAGLTLTDARVIPGSSDERANVGSLCCPSSAGAPLSKDTACGHWCGPVHGWECWRAMLAGSCCFGQRLLHAKGTRYRLTIMTATSLPVRKGSTSEFSNDILSRSLRIHAARAAPIMQKSIKFCPQSMTQLPAGPAEEGE